MAFDFSTLLSEDSRAYLAAMAAETERLYGLSDRFLARAILTYARAARQAYPDKLSHPASDGGTYTNTLFWHVAPELAYRLGERQLTPEERRPEIAVADGPELRGWLWQCLRWTPRYPAGFDGDRSSGALDPWDVLTRETANGNVLAMAADRVCPVTFPDREDGLSWHIREISRCRGFDDPHLMWSPDMQDYGDRQNRKPAFGNAAPGF